MREILDVYVDASFDAAVASPQKVAQFQHNYRRFFPRDVNAPVLDIGIGRGEMLELMRDSGFRNYHGIDISSSTVSHCRARGLSCELVEDCAKWLQSRSQTYALITLLDVIEHLERPSIIPFLEAIRGALAPGGCLIVQTPNMQAPESYLHRYQDITHCVGFSEHSLRQVALAASFTGVNCFGFETFVFVGWMRPRTYADLGRRFLRSAGFPLIRLLRLVVGNPNPRILHPVLSAVFERG